MVESFPHYVWKFQNYRQNELLLTDGRSLSIFNQGFGNNDSGPDFEQARIKIDDVEWAGHIEIYIKSSDWEKHAHQYNKAYKNVILHVVGEHDKEILLHHQPLPTLELKNLVSTDLLNKYKTYFNFFTDIPCAQLIENVSNIIFISMMDRVLVERLETKANKIFDTLKETNTDWEETTYRTLAVNFGYSINKYAFERLVKNLPFKMIRKYQNNEKAVESLLFGQAGFLNVVSCEYQECLQKEYQFLQNKHAIKEGMKREEWKFGKMRPSNFPTVRIAQFASLLCKNHFLFSQLTSIKHPKSFINSLNFSVNDYWVDHYDFNKKSKRKMKQLGKTSQDIIMINILTPLLMAYGIYVDDQDYKDSALAFLENIKLEVNRITKKWQTLAKKSKSAFDSQAMIQLYQVYCSQKKCLSCNIGTYLLKR